MHKLEEICKQLCKFGGTRCLFRHISIHLCHQKPNTARETVPWKSIWKSPPLFSRCRFIYTVLFHTFKLNTYMTSTIQYVTRKTLELILFYFPFLNALPYCYSLYWMAIRNNIRILKFKSRPHTHILYCTYAPIVQIIFSVSTFSYLVEEIFKFYIDCWWLYV